MKRLSKIKLNASKVLDDQEMKLVFGGTDSDQCSFICTCTRATSSEVPFLVNAPCNDAPWDRDTNCESGYRTCRKSSSYVDGITYA